MTDSRSHHGLNGPPIGRRAFTLVEIVVVVMILGILAGVAAPKLLSFGQDAGVAATVQDLETVALAAELFYYERGHWPHDTAGGVCPTQLRPYITRDVFASASPLGGSYDWDRNRHGVTAAIKIVAPKPTNELMLAIDAQIDDGALDTGRIVDSNGFKLIVAP